MEEITTSYKHRTQINDQVLLRLQRFNFCYGIFDDEERLLAWCLRYQSGLLKALQTHDFARQRGLALILVKVMAKEIAISGEDCLAGIIPDNIASVKLFKKLGFEVDVETANSFEFKTSSC